MNKEVRYYIPEITRDGPPGLKGMKGNKGEVGPIGDYGPKGNPGVMGPKGDFGHQGLKGDKGNKGDRGPIGKPGKKGDRGEDGKSGNRLVDFDQIEQDLYLIIDDGSKLGPISNLSGNKGQKGESGIRGITGSKGEKGDKGNKGSKGKSATDGKYLTSLNIHEDKVCFTLNDDTKFVNSIKLNIDSKENYQDKIYNTQLGFQISNGSTGRVFTWYKYNDKYYLSPFSEQKHVLVNDQIIDVITPSKDKFDIKYLLKNIYFFNRDDNFTELYTEGKEDHYKYAGSEWSIDPIPIPNRSSFIFNSYFYSSGHFVIAKGITIFKNSIPKNFSINLITNFNVENGGFYTEENDFQNNLGLKLKKTDIIENVPNYNNRIFGSIMLNDVNHFITLKVFIRFEIHHSNHQTRDIRYIYLDKNKQIQVNTVNIENTNSSALTLRAYSNWLGIGDNNNYDISDTSIWNIRNLHPFYQKYTFNFPKNKLILGDKLCARISFSIPEEIIGHINSNGDIFHTDITDHSNIINKHCDGNINNDNQMINYILSNNKTADIYWPKFLNCYLDINSINLNVNITEISDTHEDNIDSDKLNDDLSNNYNSQELYNSDSDPDYE